MSRKAEDAIVPVVAHHSDAARADHRPSPRRQAGEPTKVADASNDDGAVTRAEMTKLFGSALRVR